MQSSTSQHNMYFKLLFFLLIPIISSCNKGECGFSSPECILDHIDAFEMAYDCEGMKVDEYIFQEETVYVLHNTCCCDYTSDVLDAECQPMGILGGFPGYSEINGVRFFDHATYVRTLWQR